MIIAKRSDIYNKDTGEVPRTQVWVLTRLTGNRTQN